MERNKYFDGVIRKIIEEYKTAIAVRKLRWWRKGGITFGEKEAKNKWEKRGHVRDKDEK